MNADPLKQHWEKIYAMKDTMKEVSWYQNDPRTSINLILSTSIDKKGGIIEEDHITPFNTKQSFIHSVFKKVD